MGLECDRSDPAPAARSYRVWSGREGGIRTRDLPVPNRARYQASLLPETDPFAWSESGVRLVPNRVHWCEMPKLLCGLDCQLVTKLALNAASFFVF
jgi:hypothetical protein